MLNGVRFLLKNGSFFAIAVRDEGTAKEFVNRFIRGEMKGIISGNDNDWAIRVEEIQCIHIIDPGALTQALPATQQYPQGRLPFRNNPNMSGN